MPQHWLMREALHSPNELGCLVQCALCATALWLQSRSPKPHTFLLSCTFLNTRSTRYTDVHILFRIPYYVLTCPSLFTCINCMRKISSHITCRMSAADRIRRMLRVRESCKKFCEWIFFYFYCFFLSYLAIRIFYRLLTLICVWRIFILFFISLFSLQFFIKNKKRVDEEKSQRAREFNASSRTH